MNNIKVVTMCGSKRFKDKMQSIATYLELVNKYAVISCIFSDDDSKLSEEDMVLLGKIHFRKIEVSDAIYVVNVDGYVGESVKKEIEYAKSLNKEILSLEPLDNN